MSDKNITPDANLSHDLCRLVEIANHAQATIARDITLAHEMAKRLDAQIRMIREKIGLRENSVLEVFAAVRQRDVRQVEELQKLMQEYIDLGIMPDFGAMKTEGYSFEYTRSPAHTLPETAMDLMRAERKRQIEVEHWNATGDDCYKDGQLLDAGLAYLHHGTDLAKPAKADGTPGDWPWDQKWWKPRDRVSNLVRAGALFMAEGERHLRAGLMPEIPAIQIRNAECALTVAMEEALNGRD